MDKSVDTGSPYDRANIGACAELNEQDYDTAVDAG
jgi:hypothetical protein